MSAGQARSSGVGGEVLFYVWCDTEVI